MPGTNLLPGMYQGVYEVDVNVWGRTQTTYEAEPTYQNNLCVGNLTRESTYLDDAAYWSIYIAGLRVG